LGDILNNKKPKKQKEKLLQTKPIIYPTADDLIRINKAVLGDKKALA
jgi:hypothetical protein